jgi:hypothetical protein
MSWLAVAVAAVAAPSWLAAQDGEDGAFDRTPQDCVILQLVDQTDVIDDQNIIFTLRNHKVLRNTLPRRCPNLAREGRFMYETTSGRLCSIDTITVLEQIGVGLSRGFTCRLGEFVPLSPAEAEDLAVERKEGPRARRGIQARPVETESEDADADADPVPPPADAAEKN